MRYLIVSDIHANWAALEAVLEHAGGLYDQILCAGDLVGYCADPNAVVDWARRHLAVVIRGNHDKVCVGLDDPEWFNPPARAAAEWTGGQLTEENRKYLLDLPTGPAHVEDFQIVHGSPADEDEYLLSTGEVRQAFEHVACPLTFFGHTHMQGGYVLHHNGVRRIGKTPADCEQQILDVENGTYCLVNPGSVGQPRDGDPRAAYVIYDAAERALFYRRVAYDIRTAQAKILRAGLPAMLAQRLELGA